MDSTTIHLCLSVFRWAIFHRAKGAIKVHVGLDHRGLLPSFVSITDGKHHDVTVPRTLDLPADSFVVMDRAYTDYEWFNTLISRNPTDRNAKYRVIKRHDILKSKGLSSDQTIIFTTGAKAADCPFPLSRIGFRDMQTGEHFVFLTNIFRLAVKTIADIYKPRWHIELFFKCIKQNLRHL